MGTDSFPKLNIQSEYSRADGIIESGKLPTMCTKRTIPTDAHRRPTIGLGSIALKACLYQRIRLCADILGIRGFQTLSCAFQTLSCASV